MEREAAARPVIPRWAEEDWENTIKHLLGLLHCLPTDVDKVYKMVSGSADEGKPLSFGDICDAAGRVLFNPERLAKFLLAINPRLVELWKQETITWEQVQFYVLCLFREAAARIRGSEMKWLPSIPE
ncbi:hypothetical protein HQ563_16530 [bacterium]|nr:hypothetical protein [bacterium]